MLGRIDHFVRPEGLGQAAPRGREIGGQHRPVTTALQGGDDREPDGTAADNEAGLSRLQPREADGVLAHGQWLGRGRPGPCERLGNRQEQHLLQGHVLGQHAGEGVRIADLFDARRADDDRDGAGAGADREVRAVSGPWSTISTQNSCPKTQSCPGSNAGTPTESINPVKWVKSASAWRSEPQMPAANERATTWPEPGVTSATSPTTSLPPRVIAARISPPSGLRLPRRVSHKLRRSFAVTCRLLHEVPAARPEVSTLCRRVVALRGMPCRIVPPSGCRPP